MRIVPKRLVELRQVVRSCLELLERRDRFLLLLLFCTQMSLALLDLFGVILIGAIVAIATSAVQNQPIPSQLTEVVNFLGFENLSPQEIATIFGVTATTSLLLKSFASYYLSLRNIKFLANREAQISINLASIIFELPITGVQKYNTTDYQHALSLGSHSATVGVLGGLVSLGSEIVLQVIMAVLLFLLSPTLFLAFFIYFMTIFVILELILGRKARIWHEEIVQKSILGNRVVADLIGSYREVTVYGKVHFFLNLFEKSKIGSAKFAVKNSMLSQVSKYVFENSVVLGGAIFSAYAFLTRDALEAASMLAIFLAAATRIAPSILKIQTGILLIKGAMGSTSRFFEILNSVSAAHVSLPQAPIGKLDLSRGISLEKVTYKYPGSARQTLDEISCEIGFGEFVAIVGSSGAGKSTLIDLILGVLRPDHGTIDLFGQSPSSSYSDSLRVGYVPQNVYIFDGSLIENVCFGIPETNYDVDLVNEVIRRVFLDKWIEELPDGIYSRVGERGASLSGGQKQRIGIARALYNRPSLLVMDEATSSLDAVSENAITQAVRSLHGQITTIVIAHRLSTVVNADRIIYLQQGKIEAIGNFHQLRQSVPNFDLQAELMGISKSE